jgi:L-threonylcarbamoyladenylate synthase
LSIILPRADCIPDVVTAGLPTVAVRVPAHPVALALLRAAAIPIAAPSANRSTQLSPTTAGHVLSSLGGRIPLILDAGPTAGGIESTVVDLSSTPRVLRPGLITIAELESSLGAEVQGPPAQVHDGEAYTSPGQMQKHYAPRTPLETVEGDGSARLAELERQGLRVALIVFTDRADRPHHSTFILPGDPSRASSGLYAVLHGIDDAQFDRILVQMPADEPTWLAVRDRLRRASME